MSPRRYITGVILISRCTILWLSSLEMHWDSPFQSTLSAIVGNPYHRSACQGTRDNGAQCHNDVPKSSRINGSIQLGLFDGGPIILPSKTSLTGAAKFMLCSECRLGSSQAKQCARRWAQNWNATLSQANVASSTPSPGIAEKEIPYDIGQSSHLPWHQTSAFQCSHTAAPATSELYTRTRMRYQKGIIVDK